MFEERNLILGCDIGNGFGYVSILEKNDQDPRSLLPEKDRLADTGMPTTAYIVPPEGEKVEVFSNGRSVQKTYRRHPEQMRRAVKNLLEQDSLTIPGINKPVAPEHIFAAVVRDLVSLAEEQLPVYGLPPVYDLVFTFPAGFADHLDILDKMQRSIECVRINDRPLRVQGRIPEPAAAAIDYLYYMQHLAPEKERINSDEFTVLVYDLGYGTFDTALVTARSKGEPYVLHSSASLNTVGGKDFDELIYGMVCQQLKEKYNYVPTNEMKKEDIREAAIEAKHMLSNPDCEEWEISLPAGDEYYEVTVSREKFEEVSSGLMDQTLALVWEMLEEAAEKGIEISGIVLSGGGSNMPMVKRSLEDLTEHSLPVSLFRSGQAVSFGAARYAGGIHQSRSQQAEAEQLAEAEKTPEKRTAPKESQKPESFANPVMQQLTERHYGLWENKMNPGSGEVVWLIPQGVPRPYTGSIRFKSASSRIILRMYRSQKETLNRKYRFDQMEKTENCVSVIRVPFDVTRGANCELNITAMEDYSFRFHLTSDQDDDQTITTGQLNLQSLN